MNRKMTPAQEMPGYYIVKLALSDLYAWVYQSNDNSLALNQSVLLFESEQDCIEDIRLEQQAKLIS